MHVPSLEARSLSKDNGREPWRELDEEACECLAIKEGNILKALPDRRSCHSDSETAAGAWAGFLGTSTSHAHTEAYGC